MNKSDHKMTVNIPKEVHAEMKALAARRYMTITDWLLQAIAAAIVEEKRYD